MKIKIIVSGKVKENSYRHKIQEYLKWITKYVSVEVIYLKDIDLKKLTEKQLNHINTDIYSICLTEDGAQFSSIEFSEFIFKQNKELVFLIGPAGGHNKLVKELSDINLSFSILTFPHEMAFLILTEQLYRAISIHHGSKYHRA
tara:strand:+ start:186 stop:617 length:432 start_codon:yes stop_codon:yes gene_type:complete